MNAAARVGIEQLINENRLERVPVDTRTTAQLQSHAVRHVQTAALGLGIGDNEGCFLLSYDACRKLCSSLMSALGFRTTGDGHHVTTFEAAAVLANAFGQRSIVDAAADLRLVRNSNEYRGEDISPEDARDALNIANELLTAFDAPLARIIAASR